MTTSTIEVGVGGGSGVQVQVAPGYGEQALGQRINRIIPNSPAFHAGLEEGDVILNANGIPAESAEHLQAAVDGAASPRPATSLRRAASSMRAASPRRAPRTVGFQPANSLR